MPVAAVMRGGRPTVSSGSEITTAGSIFGWKMIFLRCVDFVEDDRSAADLGAGAGGGRHGDGRRHAGDVDARVPVVAILEIPQRPRLTDHQRDGLADVERTAAAEGDDAVALPLLL